MNTALLKQRVKGVASFSFYRDGALWYRCSYDDFVFPVPVADTGNAQGASPTFNSEEKGIYMMRWIRQAMESATCPTAS